MGKTEASTTEEISFFLGVCNVLLSTHLMSTVPETYWIYHCIKSFFLLFTRWKTWRKKKMHYYLLEFCYVVNYFTLLYFLICLLKKYFPLFDFLSALDWMGYYLFRIGFSWSMGPLALSVAFFRNGMIFHSIEHMTILATHIGPPLALYGMRWHWMELEEKFPGTFHANVNAMETHQQQVQNLFLFPAIGYIFLWTVPYMIINFSLRADKIERSGYETMFRYLGVPFLEKLTKGKVPKQWLPACYMIMHGVLSITSFSLSLILWNYQKVHSLYMLVLILVSVWNVSTFYFRVFAEKESRKKVEAAAASVRAKVNTQTK
jgi:hypothetical protein